MTIIERLATSTWEAEGSKILVHSWGALSILVKYGEKTPQQARTILVAQNPDLSALEKSQVVTWFSKINTVTLPAGELEADLMWAAAYLVEKEWITRAECKAIFDR